MKKITTTTMRKTIHFVLKERGSIFLASKVYDVDYHDLVICLKDHYKRPQSFKRLCNKSVENYFVLRKNKLPFDINQAILLVETGSLDILHQNAYFKPFLESFFVFPGFIIQELISLSTPDIGSKEYKEPWISYFRQLAQGEQSGLYEKISFEDYHFKRLIIPSDFSNRQKLTKSKAQRAISVVQSAYVVYEYYQKPVVLLTSSSHISALAQAQEIPLYPITLIDESLWSF